MAKKTTLPAKTSGKPTPGKKAVPKPVEKDGGKVPPAFAKKAAAKKAAAPKYGKKGK